jgi:hypothetical protein
MTLIFTVAELADMKTIAKTITHHVRRGPAGAQIIVFTGQTEEYPSRCRMEASHPDRVYSESQTDEALTDLFELIDEFGAGNIARMSGAVDDIGRRILGATGQINLYPRPLRNHRLSKRDRSAIWRRAAASI